MNKERKKMKEWAKITIIVASSVFGFFFLTFVVTFLGGELPWTEHRSSAVYVSQPAKWGDYRGRGQKYYFDMKDAQKRQAQFEEISAELLELGERFGVRIYFVGLVDERWVEVKCDEEDFFKARGLFNLYAKTHDVPIFWYLGEPLSFQ